MGGPSGPTLLSFVGGPSGPTLCVRIAAN
ncbi:DUF6053 domain-containing protein [Lysobacter yananisis]